MTKVSRVHRSKRNIRSTASTGSTNLSPRISLLPSKHGAQCTPRPPDRNSMKQFSSGAPQYPEIRAALDVLPPRVDIGNAQRTTAEIKGKSPSSQLYARKWFSKIDKVVAEANATDCLFFKCTLSRREPQLKLSFSDGKDRTFRRALKIDTRLQRSGAPLDFMICPT